VRHPASSGESHCGTGPANSDHRALGSGENHVAAHVAGLASSAAWFDKPLWGPHWVRQRGKSVALGITLGQPDPGRRPRARRRAVQLHELGLDAPRFSDLDSPLLADGRGLSSGERVSLGAGSMPVGPATLLIVDDIAGVLDAESRGTGSPRPRDSPRPRHHRSTCRVSTFEHLQANRLTSRRERRYSTTVALARTGQAAARSPATCPRQWRRRDRANVGLLVGALALLVESATRPGSAGGPRRTDRCIELLAFLRSPIRFNERLEFATSWDFGRCHVASLAGRNHWTLEFFPVAHLRGR